MTLPHVPSLCEWSNTYQSPAVAQTDLFTFIQIRKRAAARWNGELGGIALTGGYRCAFAHRLYCGMLSVPVTVSVNWPKPPKTPSLDPKTKYFPVP
jgi:hypothetical protein